MNTLPYGKIKPVLDQEFIPAAVWNREYRKLCSTGGGGGELAMALSRADGAVFVYRTRILPHQGANVGLNERYVERLLKFLLWSAGGSRIDIAGNEEIASFLRNQYNPGGVRAFDDEEARRLFLEPISVASCALSALPEPHQKEMPLGRHLDGCRIGFDLGGSDRKAAAVIDGEVVFSEEIAWDPYFQKDPQYHLGGIRDSLKRAAEKMPRVDAIGGSAAGNYVDNEIRAASLFRGISKEDFEAHIRPLFHRLKEEWNNIPFEVLNDGEVTALAGSMSLKDNAVLGISMGTSTAAGYCDAQGHLTPRIDELAFAPVDYREDAPADEWSGDLGCGVQYFSQQGVARLVPSAKIDLPAGMPAAEKLVEVQRLMKEGDARARAIYETIGTCFGYSIAHYAEFYDIRHLLLLGRVSSGEGGEVIVDKAQEALRADFPELAEQIAISMPDEQLKRHGQAIAAASLPEIESGNG